MPNSLARRASDLLSSRGFILGCTLATGATALVFQLVWQRYLSFLVGSEARSISLGVGVFLFGLATGYRFWGHWTERNTGSRRKLLVACGAIEAAIGAYALAFPMWFRMIEHLARAAPDRLEFDLVYASLLLLPPTFLMGGSVPLLTAALPERSEEVNACHARVYGINTLGAVLGVWLGAFWILPRFGLLGSLAAAGLVDLGVGLALACNRLPGSMFRTEPIPLVAHGFRQAGVLMLAIVSGAATIGLEIIAVRLLALNTGSDYQVFPIVLGVFVLSLALGSLSLSRLSGHLSPAVRVPRELMKAWVWLAGSYLSVPYWPTWFAQVRLVLKEGELAYGLFTIFAIVFLLVVIGPAVVWLGRLLPLAYLLLDKTSSDYGRVCGRLYFMNTLGTVAGALGLGYLALQWLNLDGAFKVVLLALAACASYFLVRLARPRLAALALALGAMVCVLPAWDRAGYFVGMFRTRSLEGLRLDGWLAKPTDIRKSNVEFYKDGPDATVSVPRFARADRTGRVRTSRSLVVNGKSDGNTLGDYSTMALVATLPYMASPVASGLSAAVIGLGTGITAGLLGKFREVEKVDVVEISSTVLAALEHFDMANYQLRFNPKAKLVQADAFRYFARAPKSRYDLIVAEPSNPWVVGVENLFTPRFYELIQQSLSDSGIYVQWVHLYEMSPEVLAGIFRNVTDSFPRAVAYLVGSSDVAILASRHALSAPHLERRFAEGFVRDANWRSGISSVKDALALHLFDERFMRHLAGQYALPRHTLERPWLSYVANRARFAGETVFLSSLMAPGLDRSMFETVGKGEAVYELYRRHLGRLPQCVGEAAGTGPVCQRLEALQQFFKGLSEPLQNAGWNRLVAYQELRSQGMVPRLPKLLEEVLSEILRPASAAQEMKRETAILLLREYEREGLAADAFRARLRLERAGVLTLAQAASAVSKK